MFLGAVVVATHRHSQRAVVTFVDAKGQGHAAGYPVGGDDERRAQGKRFLFRPDDRFDADDTARLVEDGGGDVHSGLEPGASGDVALREQVVEVEPSTGQTVGRVRVERRPVEREFSVSCHYS